MSVGSTDKLRVDELAFQEMEGHRSEPLDKEENGPEVGSALHEIFNRDLMEGISANTISQAVEAEAITPSLWSKIVSWWRGAEKPPSAQAASIDSKAALEMSTPAPISPVPALEAPDIVPADLKAADFPQSDDLGRKKLSVKQVEEALELMSRGTIETVMFIIFKAQVELEKENANIADGTFSKYLEFQKLQLKVLQEIKDVLARDENLAQKLKSAQNIAIVASFLTGVAMAAKAFNLLNPIVTFLAERAGPLAGTAFMFIATQLATIGSAVIAGITGGAKAYFQRRFYEDQAKHEEYNHRDKYLNERAEDSRNRLMTVAEADHVFKEHWARLLKRNDKLRRILLKK
jgi:hypothetical protein